MSIGSRVLPLAREWIEMQMSLFDEELPTFSLLRGSGLKSK